MFRQFQQGEADEELLSLAPVFDETDLSPLVSKTDHYPKSIIAYTAIYNRVEIIKKGVDRIFAYYLQKTSKPLFYRGFEAGNNVSLFHSFLVPEMGLEPIW